MKTVCATTLCLFLFWGGAAPGGGKDAKVDIRGTIKTAKVNKEGEKILAVILVEGKPGKDVSYDKASVKITAATKLVRVGAKDRRAATPDDLKVGTTVEITFTGPVAESYPVQATAGEVRIMVEEEKKK
jgi:hypothetical protein